MKSCLKVVIILFLICAAVTGIAAWYLPGIVIGKALEELPEFLAAQGIRVGDLKHDSVRLSGWRGVSLNGVAFSFNLAEAAAAANIRSPQARAQNFFDAEKITVTAASFSDSAVTFSIENFNLVLGGSPGSRDFRFHRFENATWRQAAPVRLSDAPASAREMVADAKKLLREGRIDAVFDFEGVAHFRLLGKESTARLYSIKENGSTRLRFDAGDVRAIARSLDIELGDVEVERVADNPLKMPGVLELTMEAKKTSLVAARSDRSVPEDAYRHVLWSYLLTERFGADFAKLITDAHETVPGNTPEERAMDYHNNAVGRDLALRKFPQANLLREVRTAPGIIRTPDQVNQ